MQFYVATDGNDQWSGRLLEPNEDKTDGPLATLAGARNRVLELFEPPRGWNAGWEPEGIDAPVTVWVRGGCYPLNRPLDFTAQNSTSVTYAAYGDEKPVIDGGVKVEGWRVEEINGVTMWVVDLPEVALGHWYFRSLFVNNERRYRPRLPKKGWSWIEDVPGGEQQKELFMGSDRFICAKDDIQAWHNLTDIDVVVMHYWVDEHMTIASFDPETRLVVSQRRSIFTLRDDVQPRYAKYYVENIFEALSDPGEWYLDRTTGRLYYVPMPGEDPVSTEVYAPRLTQLVRVQGDPDGKLVQGLRFVGLTFRHSDAVLPSAGFYEDCFHEPSSNIEYASSPQAAVHVPGALLFTGARHCAIENCTLEHLGWYGIELGDGCTGNRIVGNEIADLGAGGVKINGADANGPRAHDTAYNVVTDNHIHHAGRVFHQGVGIFSQHSYGNVLSHNHIHDLYYSGISCGWVWGYRESISRDNHIEKNHIHHLGFGWLSDMGGIYTLGVQPGTVLRGNLIHDVEKANYGGWAIYPDEGSAHMVIENNICYDTSSQPFHQHYGRENIIRNNIFAFGREGQIALSRDASAYLSFTFERNIIITQNAPCFIGGYNCRLDRRLFLSDLNIFWQVGGGEVMNENSSDKQDLLTLAQLQQLGNDRHSVIADPCCVDLEARDFTLGSDSPALALGFIPIDMSDVGPRMKK